MLCSRVVITMVGGGKSLTYQMVYLCPMAHYVCDQRHRSVTASHGTLTLHLCLDVSWSPKHCTTPTLCWRGCVVYTQHSRGDSYKHHIPSHRDNHMTHNLLTYQRTGFVVNNDSYISLVGTGSEFTSDDNEFLLAVKTKVSNIKSVL